MKISKSLLHKACALGIINSQQVEQLWTFLLKDESAQTPFNFVNLLFYLGGFIAICSITMLVSPYIIDLGRWGLVSLLFFYGLAAFVLSQYFLRNKFNIPAALCFIFIICLTPIFLSSFEFAVWMTQTPNPMNILSLFDTFEQNYLLVELGTGLMAALLFFIYRFSILLLPLCLITWYIIYDLSQRFFGSEFFLSDLSKNGIFLGFIFTSIAVYLDIKHKKHYENSFWLYIFGVTFLWFGYMDYCLINTEWSWLCYAMMNLVLLCFGVILSRRIFLVYGGLGMLIYLGHIIYELFNTLNINWLLGSFILTFIGLFIIKLGMLIHQHQNQIKIFIYRFLPDSLKIFLKEHDE